MQVDFDRCEVPVPQEPRHDARIVLLVKDSHRAGMAQYVGRDGLARDRGAARFRDLNVFGEPVGDAVVVALDLESVALGQGQAPIATRMIEDGITHGGFISALIDAGAGTAAHRSANGSPCVTISLELKFISAVPLGRELIGRAKIQKKTKSMVFLTCELMVGNKIAATASGIWKILKLTGAGPGG